MRSKISKWIVVALLGLVGCIPNITELGGGSASGLLSTSVPTAGLLDSLQVPNGSVATYIDSFGLQIEKVCGGEKEQYVSPAYDFSNQNVSYSLDPACDYSIMMLLGKNAGPQVSPVYAFNLDAVPLTISSAQLKSHLASTPDKAFPMDIRLGLTKDADAVKMTIAGSGQQPSQPSQPIPVQPTPPNPTVIPTQPQAEESLGNTQPVSQCKVIIANGRANGTYWCGPCQQFEPTWNSIKQSNAGRAEFVSVDYSNMTGFDQSQPDAQSKLALVSGVNVRSFPSLILIDKAGSARVSTASSATVQSFLQSSCN